MELDQATGADQSEQTCLERLASVSTGNECLLFFSSLDVIVSFWVFTVKYSTYLLDGLKIYGRLPCWSSVKLPELLNKLWLYRKKPVYTFKFSVNETLHCV